MSSQTTARTGWLTQSVVAIGAASLFSDLSHEMATTILPAFLATEIGASALALGAIEGVADGLASFFKLIGGWLTDKIGRRKPVAVSGYVLTTLATASFALAVNWMMILASRTLAWMARGWRGPARNALLADSVQEEFYGNAFGFERAMDTVGAILAPLLALTFITMGFGYRSIFVLTMLPGMLAVVSLAFFVKESKCAPQPERKLLGDVKSLPRSFIYYLIIAGIFGLGQFAPTLLVLRATQVTGKPQAAIGLYVLFNAVQAASAYTIGSLARRLGSIKLLGLSYLGFAVVAAGFAFGNTDLSTLILLFALAGLSVGGIEAMEPTVAADLLPSNMRGTGFGALGAANGIGDLLSSLLVGGLWTSFSAAVGFGFAATFNGLSVALLVLWARRDKGGHG